MSFRLQRFQPLERGLNRVGDCDQRQFNSEKLHKKYCCSGEESDWLVKLISDGQERSHLVFERNSALHAFINLPKGEKEVIRELRSLGGRKARLKNQRQGRSELPKVEMYIAYLRGQMKNRQLVKRLTAQLPWHYVAVLIYEFLHCSKKRKSADIEKLCQWLSIPELRLKCTRDTIKAVRKRIVFNGSEEILGLRCRKIEYYSGKNVFETIMGPAPIWIPDPSNYPAPAQLVF
jgi:hypothetical protein